MFDILLFFGIAGIVVPILKRCKISPVLGYLICGIIVGPHGLADLSQQYNWLTPFTITDHKTVNILGELGIVALMFMIGLGLSFERLKELKLYIFGLGSLQISITALAIFLVALLFDNSIEVSLLIGASFALSSTAIVMNLLEEKKLSKKPIGVLNFSILLMQDLAVVPILVLAISFSSFEEGNITATILESLVIGILTVIVILFIGKKLLKPLLHSMSIYRNPEWLTSFTVFIIILCSTVTYMAGLSFALGAFLAGLLIAETEFRDEVETIISPLKGILLGIFFISIGMMIDIAEIFRYPLLLLASIIGIYLLKAMILYPLCRVFKISKKQSLQSAIYLSQPGEFALLILGTAHTTKLMPEENIQFFLLVTATAMTLTPAIFKLAPYLTRKIEAK
jgi:CPA2 family monovalent cation:H+ antiporter-2